MPEQQSSAESAAPTEEAVANAENAAPAPPLNREQRRAQAKGKKGGDAFNPALPHAANTHGPGTRGAAGGQTRFQRKSGGK